MSETRRIPKLGERIKKLRLRKAMTLEKLAYGSGISKGNLSDIEQGKKDARFSTLKLIAEGLDLTISELLSGL